MLSTMCSHGSLPQGNAETWWESQCLAQCAHMEACHKKMQKHAVNHNAYLFFYASILHVGLSALVVPWFSWSLVLIVLGLLGLLGLVLVASWHSSVGQSPGSSGSMAFGILCRWHIVPGFLDPNPGPAAWAGAVLGPVLLPIGWAFHQLGQIYPAWWPWLVTPWWSPILVICGAMAILVHICCCGTFHGISHGWLAIWKHSVLGASWLWAYRSQKVWM